MVKTMEPEVKYRFNLKDSMMHCIFGEIDDRYRYPLLEELASEYAERIMDMQGEID